MATRRPSIQSSDVDMEDPKQIDLASDKPVDDDQIFAVTGETMDDERIKKLMKEEADMNAFMNQKITFEIMESDDPNAPNPVPCGVNGQQRAFHRNTEYTEQRKFVESLLKVSRKVKTINYKDRNGVDQTKIEVVPKMVYPVRIIKDPAGKLGQRWFKHQQMNG